MSESFEVLGGSEDVRVGVRRSDDGTAGVEVCSACCHQGLGSIPGP